jgi:hypothetical protein
LGCLRPDAICHAYAVATVGTQVQWGDVATWVGGSATAIALLLTYGLLRITRREQRTLQIEKRQAQARLISAWSSGIERVSDGPIHAVTVILQNSSDEPVYGMRAAVGSQWQARNGAISYAELGLDYILPPKARQERAISLELPRTMATAAESSLPVELLFRDAAGRYWHRDRYGELTQITKKLPPPGGEYFFKSAASAGRPG